MNNSKDLRIFNIKPLGCIKCGQWETEWVPVYRNFKIVQTILVCEKCGHNERLEQPAFESLFKSWLEWKLKGQDFQKGLSNYLNQKN
jgi:hypothetical protein